MTADPPPSPEGTPLASRHRPVLGDLAKSTMEMDLWSFDDELDEGAAPVVQSLTPQPRFLPVSQPGKVVPERRDSKQEASGPQSDEEVTSPQAAEERIRLKSVRSPDRRRTLGDYSNSLKRVEDFNELEQWDVGPKPEGSRLDGSPEALTWDVTHGAVGSPQTAPVGGAESADFPAAVVSPAGEVLEKPESGGDEFSPLPRDGVEAVSLRPRMGLTKVEKVGVIALLVMLVAAGIVIYEFSVNRLPTESIKAKATDFPIKGSRVTVTSSESYWRVPIVDGPNPDVFRRGTELLPVIEIAVSGGSGAIRVVFRDENRKTMGDSITRSVEGNNLLKIVATAGFEDMGMYAAYRTGGHKPWTAEVSEGPSLDAPSAEFTKLFEMELSTAIR